MFASTVGTSEREGRREKWHCGWWGPKTMMLFSFIFFPFAFPSKLISIYGKISIGGAGMASFIIWVQKRCYSEKSKLSNSKFRRAVAGILHFLCIVGIVILYVWYAPHASCSLNISIISGTIILYIIMSGASFLRSVNGGFLSSGIMGIYVIYLCWCALKSEPQETCMREGGSSKEDVFTIISFFAGLITMAVVTFTTGIDSKCFTTALKREDEDDEVPYGYGFFHFVFATGSMYSAMVLVAWDTNHHMQKFTIDIGWTSTIVRIVNEIVAVIIYGLVLMIKPE
ncbi:unnamed protein product [Cuscuta campestris]|uniref:Serine incorporator n=1 Tax=Cuscuta campestris TaxID=132261 RepID=A0A484KWI5_9ASTE|nr:unnamed protein product [Cuscuta campestris]